MCSIIFWLMSIKRSSDCSSSLFHFEKGNLERISGVFFSTKIAMNVDGSRSLCTGWPIPLLSSCPVFSFYPNQWMSNIFSSSLDSTYKVLSSPWWCQRNMWQKFSSCVLSWGELFLEVSSRFSSTSYWLELGHWATALDRKGQGMSIWYVRPLFW